MKKLRILFEIEIPNVNAPDVDLDDAVKRIANSEMVNPLLDLAGEDCGVCFGDWTMNRLPDPPEGGS